MENDIILVLINQALTIISQISAPIILSSLICGFSIALLQAATQINEVTLTFVPKIILAGLMIFIFGNWMLETLSAFTIHLYESIPHIIGTR